jgi:DNA-binding HxlR family transcriptional regulator
MDPRVEKVETTMRLIGARWVPAIMNQLINHGTSRFSELRRAIPAVTQRMLTKQLRELEEAGLIRREQFATIPPRVEYSATPVGMSLRNIYMQVCHWADEHPEILQQDHPESGLV